MVFTISLSSSTARLIALSSSTRARNRENRNVIVVRSIAHKCRHTAKSNNLKNGAIALVLDFHPVVAAADCCHGLHYPCLVFGPQ